MYNLPETINSIIGVVFLCFLLWFIRERRKSQLIIKKLRLGMNKFKGEIEERESRDYRVKKEFEKINLENEKLGLELNKLKEEIKAKELTTHKLNSPPIIDDLFTDSAIEDGDVPEGSLNKENVLTAAIDWGDIEAVRSLIVKGADVNAKDKKGKTAMMYAAEKGHIQIVKLLKRHGAKE